MHVIHAKQVLAVADDHLYKEATCHTVRKNRDALVKLVSCFNQERLKAIEPKYGGGSEVKYGVPERDRIL